MSVLITLFLILDQLFIPLMLSIILVISINCSLIKRSSWKLYRQFRSKELLVKYKEISQLWSKSIKYLVVQREMIILMMVILEIFISTLIVN